VFDLQKFTYAAPRATQGFEWQYNWLGSRANTSPWLLTPNTAFSKGDMVVLTYGKVAKAAATGTNILGVMGASITTTQNPAASETYAPVWCNPFDIFRCTFADHIDSVATGGTTVTLLDTTLAASTDNYWRGALLYIYEGPGKGDIRRVASYTGATDTLTVSRAFSATPTTATKYILLGYGGALDDTIYQGRVGVDLKDENTIDANAASASEAGPLLVVEIDPENLWMDVMIRKHLFNSV